MPAAVNLVRRGLLPEPDRRIVEQEAGDAEGPVEGVAQELLAGEHPGERDLLAGDDREATHRRVGHGPERVGRRDLERELDAADAGEVDRETQQVGRLRQRRDAPVERQREEPLVGRVLVVGQGDDGVLEVEQRPAGSTSRAR